MHDNKELLRLWLKSKRMGLSAGQVEESSKLIIESLIDLLNWNTFKNVHCYQAISSLNEPSTEGLLRFLQAHKIQHTIQEQADVQPDNSVRYDAVIVPTLGFDLLGNRMGWGGGFYDRFLAAQPKALKVGICYENGLVRKGIPTEPHDIRLDLIVSEKTIRNFKRTGLNG